MINFIVPAHLKSLLIEELLAKDGHLFNTKIMTIREFIKTCIAYEDVAYFDLYQELNTLELHIFKDSLSDLSFLKELVTNRYILDAYRLDLNNLDLDEEYKLLLKTIPSINLDKLYRALDGNFNDYTILDAYYPFFEAKIIKTMINHGAKTYSFEHYNNHQDLKIIAQNERQALDKIARLIIEQDLALKDVALIANKSSFNFIKTHLKRYGINVKSNTNFQVSYIAKKLVAILDFYLNPNKETYLKLVSLNTLGQYDTLTFKEFINNHLKDLEFHLSERFITEKGYYHDIEETYNEVHNVYLPFINELLSYDFNDALIFAFNTVKDLSDETKMIKHIIENYKNNPKSSYNFYRHELLALETKEDIDGLTLDTYQNDIYLKPYIFVLDPNINNYPGFKTLNGLINENTVKNTDYPDIEERFNHHKNLHEYLHFSKVTYYVLCKSTLAGKSIEYDEKFMHYNEYELEVNEDNETKLFTYDHKLSKAIALKTFLNKGTITGSVSSFEKYFNCPYSYFLNYGLKLKEPQTMELNAATTGTIIHAVFEELALLKGKEYYKDPEDTINLILKKYQERLNYLYPNLSSEIEATIERIKASVLLEMIFIESMEKDTYFEVKEAEYQFEYEILKDEDSRILLRGIIDRVDKFGPYFRIIDYKTSDHSLNKEKITRGLQLQLLTYALIYQELSQTKPIGVFYLNVKHSKIDGDEYRFLKTKGLELTSIDENYLYNEYMKAHKLSGMVFEDVEGLDLEYKHIKTRKKGCISDQYMIDLDKTKALLKEIYAFLLNEIKEGKIALKPNKGACDYCIYHRICHFKGLQGLNDEAISNIDINVGQTNETE